MKLITSDELYDKYGESLRDSSPIFEKHALVSDLPLIKGSDVLFEEVNGRKRGYALFDGKPSKVVLRELGQLQPDTVLGVHLTLATRATEKEYGGYEVGTPGTGLYKVSATDIKAHEKANA